MKNKAMHFLYLFLLMFPAGFLAGVSNPTASPVAGLEPYGGAYVVFAGKFGGAITRQEIASHSDVQVEGCARGSRIFQFTLRITKNGTTTTFKNTSNRLTDQMIARLKSLSKGDSFDFQQTKAYLPNSRDVVDVHGKKFIVV